jgi:alkylation response protein AidB-like acyl-CoA dehydrogenase
MDLRDSEQEAAFRADLRAWLQQTLPTLPPEPHREDWPGRRRFDGEWQRRLFDAGYAGIDWPAEYGGRGASPTESLIFLEELARAQAPTVGVNFVGLLHAGPTLIAEASDEQKAAHLPRILRGEEVWCQGFSEPSAGSDLASLRTRAVRDGDEYVITGQKIWTSFAQVADYCEMLVRTNTEGKKHSGITWLIMPMDAPGIDVRPLRTVIGSSEFSELFLDEVRVPIANRVGEENDGWRVAMVTFSFERGTSLVGEMLATRRLLEEELPKLARSLGKWDDPILQREVGQLVAELDGLWALTQRTVSEAAQTGVPGVGGSLVKLQYSELVQRLGDVAFRLMDRSRLTLDEMWVDERLRVLALPIAAGSSQIQRNIIGERILGLPR